MMKRPSGDQTGLNASVSRSRIAAPPSIGILNTRVPSPWFAATTTHLPSGDHDAALCTSMDFANVVRPVPWALITESSARPCLRYEKEMRVPSGEIAGAATTPPSPPFHSSTALPVLSIFQRPSAPPFDERNAR